MIDPKDPKVIETLIKRTQGRTPDWLELVRYEHLPVFVYGTLMEGQVNHQLIAGSKRLGAARTTTSAYMMYRAPGDFPVVRQASMRSPSGGRVKGEVYAIHPRLILDLDDFEHNGEVFIRTLRSVFLDQTIQGHNGQAVRPSLKCWMYMGAEEYWDDMNIPINFSTIADNKRQFRFYKGSPYA